eukprot:4214763-Alexandrium_andersonii.AAC.1
MGANGAPAWRAARVSARPRAEEANRMPRTSRQTWPSTAWCASTSTQQGHRWHLATERHAT